VCAPAVGWRWRHCSATSLDSSAASSSWKAAEGAAASSCVRRGAQDCA
jgi:hypothetical protein